MLSATLAVPTFLWGHELAARGTQSDRETLLIHGGV